MCICKFWCLVTFFLHMFIFSSFFIYEQDSIWCGAIFKSNIKDFANRVLDWFLKQLNVLIYNCVSGCRLWVSAFIIFSVHCRYMYLMCACVEIYRRLLRKIHITHLMYLAFWIINQLEICTSVVSDFLIFKVGALTNSQCLMN